jgi:hypothetical protein
MKDVLKPNNDEHYGISENILDSGWSPFNRAFIKQLHPPRSVTK